MRVEGIALVVRGDNVDTDVMYPGAYLNVEDPDQMAQYLFEGFDPTLRERLVDGTILVVGANFGIGSSREHVPLAMKGVGSAASSAEASRGSSTATASTSVSRSSPARRRSTPHETGLGSPSTRRARSRSTASRSTRPLAPPLVLELGAAGGLVDWTASQIAG